MLCDQVQVTEDELPPPADGFGAPMFTGWAVVFPVMATEYIMDDGSAPSMSWNSALMSIVDALMSGAVMFVILIGCVMKASLMLESYWAFP